jgi:hypothetical protein
MFSTILKSALAAVAVAGNKKWDRAELALADDSQLSQVSV